MQGVRAGGHVGGKDYRKTDFFWAVVYMNRISAIYPRQADARREAYPLNARWERNGWGRPFRIVRFRYHFKGAEIDAYVHSWERTEAPKKRKARG